MILNTSQQIPHMHVGEINARDPPCLFCHSSFHFEKERDARPYSPATIALNFRLAMRTPVHAQLQFRRMVEIKVGMFVARQRATGPTKPGRELRQQHRMQYPVKDRYANYHTDSGASLTDRSACR